MAVGGYAVGLHGYPRYTGDLDIWINISESNADKMLIVLKDFGVQIQSLTKNDFLRETLCRACILDVSHCELIF